MERIGFFGGSFNPPTIAHLEIVKLAIKEMKLDKVVIVPMGDKYEKKDLIEFEHRYKMLKMLFKNNNQVEISRMQANQIKRSYAIDSFKNIDNEYKNDKRFFIMGLDNFSSINTWKNSEELLQNHNFIVFKRNSIDISLDLPYVHFFDINKNISSSLVRKRINNFENLENIITYDIEKYIRENELYK